MAKLLRAAAFFLLLSACCAPAFAQTGGVRDEEARALLLSRIRGHEPRNPREQRAVYELGKEFLRKYGDRPLDEADAQIAAYIRQWVLKYELALYGRNRRVPLPTRPRPVCRRRDP